MGMSNAGGAWDNSKKYIEIECTPEDPDDKKANFEDFEEENPKTPSYKMKPPKPGDKKGFPTIPKGTDHHDACVVGDTVGDPFKDTSGPALNILIKLMSMVSLTIAPLIKPGTEASTRAMAGTTVVVGELDWQNFYLGFIPFVIMILVTIFYTVRFGNILEDKIDYSKKVKGEVGA